MTTYSHGRGILFRLLLWLLFAGIVTGNAQAASATRTSAFEYDPATGLLVKEIIEPDLPQLRQDTAYTYDATGNKITATVTSPATGIAAITARTSSTTYDSRGQFPVASTNALGQSETRIIDAATGNLTSLTGPNGLTTQWQYDSFHRKIREIRADGNQTQWNYLYCNGINGGTTACPALATYLVQVTPQAANGSQNGPWSKTYFDALEREIRAETQGFDGTSVIVKETEYDHLGRVSRISDPYYNGQPRQWSTSTYDVIGRVIAVTLPDNSQTTSAYNGLTTSTTNALSQTQTKVRNSQGQLIRVTDALNNSITSQYDPFGNLTSTTDPLGNTTTLTYDQRGRKTRMTDPDMGIWNYEYDVLGELVRQTDAKNQVTTIAYDRLGRITSRAEPDLISSWTFDNCNKGIGKPCTATTDNGYSRSHSYDSLGRAVSTATTIDTGYTASVTFDTNGRVATETYPTGFAVKYVYTSLGYLQEVRNNATNALYWQANTMDAQGHLLQQTYGNGVVIQKVYETTTGRLKNSYAGAGNRVQNLSYTYDSLGNLQSRSDAIVNLSETFLYDNLNRLTSATVNSSGAGLVTQTFAYNAIGNITSRSDVGTYTYGTVNNRPHAVTEVQLAAGGKRQYSYDANGALISEVQFDAANNVITNKGRTEIYTSYGMPQALGSPGLSLAFAYNSEHQRVKQIAPATTTIYLHPDNSGGLFYEKDLKADGTTEHKHFITAGGQVIAVVKQTSTGSTVTWFHRDNLGSTTAMTNEAGGVMELLAYEAFGKRRFPAGMTDLDNTIIGINTDRGYTNHEHLDELGLIHMNGRIYDPTLGRFTSADPYIQAPDNLQSYNRYSYVLNNPLAFTDPSGYFSLGKVVRVIAAVVIAYYTGTWVTGLVDGMGAAAAASAAASGAAASASSAAMIAGGMAGGFVGGMINSGGDLRAGMQGAFSGALFAGVGNMQLSGAEQTFAHGMAGGLSSLAAGGKFGAGFMSASFAEYAGSKLKFDSIVAQGIARMVVGGTASVIGGGKFENGAMTAAYGYMFNELAHQSTMAQRGYPTSSWEKYQWDMEKMLGPSSLTADGCMQTGGPSICFGPAAIESVGAKALPLAAEFFKAPYTPKVLDQIKVDIYHGFPAAIDDMARQVGQVSKITGGDGSTYLRLQVQGAINGTKGVFEYITNKAGEINHRLFRPNY